MSKYRYTEKRETAVEKGHFVKRFGDRDSDRQSEKSPFLFIDNTPNPSFETTQFLKKTVASEAN